MTNLTPSEARRLIDKLHHNQTKEHGISILEEKYLIGLEKALPFLDPIDIDSEALAVAREVMGIMYGPMPSGGSVQLMAQVQCLIIDAMKVARGEKNLSLQQTKTDTYRQIENDGREG